MSVSSAVHAQFTRLHQPCTTPFSGSATSLVIPVRNNQRGIDRFLAAVPTMVVQPAEIVVVDSASSPRIVLNTPLKQTRLLRVEEPGAARARNAGWQAASSNWILFCDSDCVPTETSISGYASSINGSIAYSGFTRSLFSGALAEYYDKQEILTPPPDDRQRPAYLVTANLLVLRAALEAVEGFDETFPGAGGEDIDLAYRLREIGDFSFAPGSVVLHDFSDGLRGFVDRCLRYGRGNRLLEERHGYTHKPRLFSPRHRIPMHYVLALSQFLLMRAGYEGIQPPSRFLTFMSRGRASRSR